MEKINSDFLPILGISLLTVIVDLGAPLDYHLILGAGLYTFIYIAARAFGKYFGARAGAKLTHMPDTVCKYLGLTLLPHSGVSLVFTGIICSTLDSAPELVQIVQGTIAAAAVINEFIALVAAKKKDLNLPEKSRKHNTPFASRCVWKRNPSMTSFKLKNAR